MQIPLPFIDSDTGDLGQNPEISILISTPANLDVGDPDPMILHQDRAEHRQRNQLGAVRQVAAGEDSLLLQKFFRFLETFG